jgi:hypothetical protein
MFDILQEMYQPVRLRLNRHWRIYQPQWVCWSKGDCGNLHRLADRRQRLQGYSPLSTALAALYLDRPPGLTRVNTC